MSEPFWTPTGEVKHVPAWARWPDDFKPENCYQIPVSVDLDFWPELIAKLEGEGWRRAQGAHGEVIINPRWDQE